MLTRLGKAYEELCQTVTIVTGNADRLLGQDVDYSNNTAAATANAAASAAANTAANAAAAATLASGGGWG